MRIFRRLHRRFLSLFTALLFFGLLLLAGGLPAQPASPPQAEGNEGPHGGGGPGVAPEGPEAGISIPASPSGWSGADYATFDEKSFASHEPANRSIDFTKIDYPLLNAAIFYETNRIRVSKGKERLRHSLRLEMAAYIHSKLMVERNFFSHVNRYDTAFDTPLKRMESVGVTGATIGENIALEFGILYEAGRPLRLPTGRTHEFSYFDTGEVIPVHTYNSFAKAVLKNWMASPPHRSNILSGEYRYLGCAAYPFKKKDFGGMDYFKATQNFSSRVPEEK